MAVLAAVMLQNLDEDDDNSSTSSRGSSSGGSGSSSGSSIGSGSSYDSGVAWTTTDTTNGFNYGTPSSNHSGRRRRKPTTPHRIVCSSPVKNAFLNETERIDMLLQVSGNQIK